MIWTLNQSNALPWLGLTTNIGQTDRSGATKLGNGLHHNSIKRVSSWMMYARQTARAIPNCSFYRVYNGLNHFLSTVISITSNVC